jgi:SAM-dependent methyltransferase
VTAPGYGAPDESRYRDVLAAQGRSPTLRAIWREVYGTEYPEEADPLGFATVSELTEMARAMAGGTIVDLGCGRGGPGMWIARAAGAGLVGVDLVPEAVAEASARAAAFGLEGRARFEAASLAATGLPGGSFDGAVSVDALWMVLNKPAALREAARLLRAGAPLALTTWEPPHLSYAALARKAGLEVVSVREPEGWRARQVAVYAGIRARRDRLASEMGEAAADVLVAEAEAAPAMLEASRRILLLARKPLPGAAPAAI